jgi:hypothetical protein
MSRSNPLWGAPRIHGELLKLGFDVAQSTVARYMCGRWRPPSQGWRTFLSNHADGIAAVELKYALTRSEFGLLNIYRLLAGGTRGTRALKYYGTGGAELPLVLDKTDGHATLIRDSLLAKPHRIRRAGICILLGIGDCGDRGRDHDDENNGAQFTHDVALQMGVGVTMIGAGICSIKPSALWLWLWP